MDKDKKGVAEPAVTSERAEIWYLFARSHSYCKSSTTFCPLQPSPAAAAAVEKQVEEAGDSDNTICRGPESAQLLMMQHSSSTDLLYLFVISNGNLKQ